MLNWPGAGAASYRKTDSAFPHDTQAGNRRYRSARALNPVTLPRRQRLADGSAIGLRAITPDDRLALREQLFLKLGKEALRNRFFCVKADLTELELTRFCRVDFCRHVAIVAETISPDGGRLVGVGRIIGEEAGASAAEIAITVQDHYQGRGIGSLLLAQLVDCARRLGIDRLDAMMYAQNHRMANLLRGSGLRCAARTENEFLHLSLDLRPYWLPSARGTAGRFPSSGNGRQGAKIK